MNLFAYSGIIKPHMGEIALQLSAKAVDAERALLAGWRAETKSKRENYPDSAESLRVKLATEVTIILNQITTSPGTARQIAGILSLDVERVQTAIGRLVRCGALEASRVGPGQPCTYSRTPGWKSVEDHPKAKRIRELAASGMADEVIASRTKLSKAAVAEIRHAMGVPAGGVHFKTRQRRIVVLGLLKLGKCLKDIQAETGFPKSTIQGDIAYLRGAGRL